jgi:2-polyprenyl-3-methyl-5-hydroxy-6-metoxy-1,4-benzoquinol methylase
MTQEFWNERYGMEEFAYGRTANDFLQTQTFPSGSKILCLAEGEGRNGVFLAKQGHDVTCIDYSESGIRKMQVLAKENGVDMVCICADLNHVELEPNTWDGIVLIFGHFPENLRKFVHEQIYTALKPSGKVVLEAYNKSQIEYKTGGPMTTDLLYSKEELASDFSAFNELSISEKVREVKEGKFHFGKAAVIQVVGVK